MPRHMMPKPLALTARQREKLMLLCREVNRVDDRIGQRSDHEGDENGPTYQVFTEATPDRYDDIADAMIELHRDGIRAWRKLQRLRQTANLNPENQP